MGSKLADAFGIPDKELFQKLYSLSGNKPVADQLVRNGFQFPSAGKLLDVAEKDKGYWSKFETYQETMSRRKRPPEAVIAELDRGSKQFKVNAARQILNRLNSNALLNDFKRAGYGGVDNGA